MSGNESNGGMVLSHPALSPRPLTVAALELSRYAMVFVGLGGLLMAGAMMVTVPMASLGLALTGMVFVSLGLLVKGFGLRQRTAASQLYRTVAEFAASDPVACALTDVDGMVNYANPACGEQFSVCSGQSLAAAFNDVFAAPSSVFYRLQNKALAVGSAREDVLLRRGTLRLSVNQVGKSGFFWRLENDADRSRGERGGEGISLPFMTVSKNDTILFMNEAMRILVGGRETTLERVLADLPLRPGEMHHLTKGSNGGAVLALSFPLSAGRREVYLIPDPTGRLVEPGEWGIVESLPVPLLRLDAEGRVAMANRRARLLLNCDDPVGLHFSDLVEGLGRPVSGWLREAMNGRNLGRPETMRASLAEERFLQVSLEQFRDESGLALVAVLNDATELKVLETQFVQSQKMQAIGQLAGGVAHDFNNLLTAISGHCDLLLLRHDSEDPDYSDLSQISQNANRAAALVGQLLAFSRKQTLRPEVLDLAGTVGDLTHLLGRLVGERIRLDFDPGHDILPVRADKRQLEQVLMNLVVNARDAMTPGGGQIRLVLSNVYLSEPLERDRAVLQPGDYVTIRVIDSGTGISPEHVDKIFEPFFTTKGAGKGTGLGLSMVYGIVKQSGGFIFVESVPGNGTTFTLFFPVFEEDMTHYRDVDAVIAPQTEQLAHDTCEPEGHEPLPQATLEQESLPSVVPDPQSALQPTETAQVHDAGVVLLVEDEAPVRAFAARALRLKGLKVLEADSAESALSMLEDETLKVDVFVTDVIMPGLDGPTWVARALETRPTVRVVFVSGYAEDSVAEHQARIPQSVFLPKPFSLSELCETVTRQVDSTRESA